jgi:hypothetical protein
LSRPDRLLPGEIAVLAELRGPDLHVLHPLRPVVEEARQQGVELLHLAEPDDEPAPGVEVLRHQRLDSPVVPILRRDGDEVAAHVLAVDAGFGEKREHRRRALVARLDGLVEAAVSVLDGEPQVHLVGNDADLRPRGDGDRPLGGREQESLGRVAPADPGRDDEQEQDQRSAKDHGGPPRWRDE